MLNYTRRFLRAYPAVPKFAVAAFPAPVQGGGAGWPHKASALPPLRLPLPLTLPRTLTLTPTRTLTLTPKPHP